MLRRRYLALVGGCSALGLAGCSSDDRPEPVDQTEAPDGNGSTGDEPTAGPTTTQEPAGPRTAEVAVGEVVTDDTLEMVVRSVERTDSLGQFQQADAGNTFVVIRMAVKNATQDEYLNFSSLLQTTLSDDENYTYDPTFAVSERRLADGQLVPGEVTRGDVVFEVPTDASGLVMRFDFEAFDFVDLDRVTVRLDEQAAPAGDLRQSLQVDIYSPGDGVEFRGITTTLNSVRRVDAIGSFTSPEQGNEFVIVDISVSNRTGEQQSVSSLLQMNVKDGDGFSYAPDIVATSQLDRGYSEGSPIGNGETRRGEITYEVPQGVTPLYWTFEFTLFTEGDKMFWRLA